MSYTSSCVLAKTPVCAPLDTLVVKGSRQFGKFGYLVTHLQHCFENGRQDSARRIDYMKGLGLHLAKGECDGITPF